MRRYSYYQTTPQLPSPAPSPGFMTCRPVSGALGSWRCDMRVSKSAVQKSAFPGGTATREGADLKHHAPVGPRARGDIVPCRVGTRVFQHGDVIGPHGRHPPCHRSRRATNYLQSVTARYPQRRIPAALTPAVRPSLRTEPSTARFGQAGPTRVVKCSPPGSWPSWVSRWRCCCSPVISQARAISGCSSGLTRRLAPRVGPTT